MPEKLRVGPTGVAVAAVLLAFSVLLMAAAAPAGAAYWHACRSPQAFPVGSLKAHRVHCEKARRILGGFYRNAQSEGPDIFVDHFHCVAFSGGVGCRRDSQKVRVTGLPEGRSIRQGPLPETRASSGRPERCDPPYTSTLLETAKVRIYATPAESEGHAEQREPTFDGRPVFACLRASGRSRLLDLPEVGGERRTYWVKVDERVFAVNAPLVAYVYSQYYLDTHQTWIRVRNLYTGGVVRTCLVGSGIAPFSGPQVTDIVLSAGGEVGWDTRGPTQPSAEGDEPGCNPAA